MKGQLTRLAIVGTVFLLGGATAASAAEYYDDEEGMDCAEYISSGRYDDPLTGDLLGSETVKESSTTSLNTSATVGGGAVPASVGGSTSDTSTVTVEYEVGYYRMSDGSILRIDCRTYTVK